LQQGRGACQGVPGAIRDGRPVGLHRASDGPIACHESLAGAARVAAVFQKGRAPDPLKENRMSSPDSILRRATHRALPVRAPNCRSTWSRDDDSAGPVGRQSGTGW